MAALEFLFTGGGGGGYRFNGSGWEVAVRLSLEPAMPVASAPAAALDGTLQSSVPGGGGVHRTGRADFPAAH